MSKKPEALLGVLVGRRTAHNRPYHEQTTFFRRLIREGRGIDVAVFVFSPPGIRWRHKQIAGWTWTGRRWERRVYPFPDAVYDRVSPKQRADLRVVDAVRRRFSRRGIPLFNTRIGDKWTLHRHFSKDPSLRESLPRTRILTKATLAEMLAAHGAVYTKPANGGQGKGVGWARRTGDGYVYRVQKGRGQIAGRVRTVRQLLPRCRGGRRRMLVQQAIAILNYQHRPFDVRALVQRGLDGEWRVTGMVARLGAPHKKVTNIHAGGRALPLEAVLKECGADEALVQEVLEKAHQLALSVAHSIAARARLVAELGIDIAIDRDFKLWLLEANSRTGRISLHRAGLGEAARRGDRAPAEFALYCRAQRKG